MIVAHAPLRISFAGGGTDLPAYYEQHGGLVLSTTITRSVYAVLSPGDYEQVQIISSDYRAIHAGRPHPDEEGDHLALPWAVVQAMGLERGASIFLASEVPPGTGLGSSSATAVALIAAIAAFQGRPRTPAQLAELASHVEIVRLGQPIGKQDQYAAAFGGVNVFSFSPDGTAVTPLPLCPDVRRGLEAHLALYFTGSTRQARAILQEQRRRSASGDTRTIEALHALKAQVAPMRAALAAGDYAAMGALLHEAWQMKRRVSSGISTDDIDTAYATARSAGALGGKITGAGGGGFLLLLVPPDAQETVRMALAPLGLRPMRFGLEPHGAHTIQATGDRRQATVDQATGDRRQATVGGSVCRLTKAASGAGSHGDV
jgi:D-glycero-alpha-D-manno-heptose-7-phosphate kinase